MSAYPGAWLLCGGWAVDAWLGGVTRSHGDIDVMVFHDDQRAAFQQFAAWDLVAHDAIDPGPTTEFWAGRELKIPAHVHARPRDENSPGALLRWVIPPHEQVHDDRNVELILNERQDGRWVLHTEAGVSLPWQECVKQSTWGIPTAAPEVLLFYKATAYWGVKRMKPRPQDEIDFRALLPLLSSGQKQWLRQAVGRVVPEHPWLADL